MKSRLLLVAAVMFAAPALAELPPGHPALGQSAPADAMHAPKGGPEVALTEQGKVLSVVDTQGFTYIEVQQAGSTLWVAVPTTKAKAGDTLRFPKSTPMASYHSQSLNRTFSNVIFVSKVAVEGSK